MFFRSIVLALCLGMATPLLAAQDDNAEEPEETTETVNPFFERLVTPDRNLQRRYEQAERLINAERYAEAGQLLGSILESSSDLFVLPPDPTQQTTTQTFDGEILRKIEQLPETGRNSYRLQYETLAQRLLNDAVERGSLEGVQVVARNYFPTPAGIDATFLLGMAQFEQGTTGSAMFTLRKLQRRGLNTDAHEPTLSLTLAACQLRLGRNDDAKETLERFLKRFPKPEILLGGNEPWTPQNVDELLDRLRRTQGQPRPLSDWIEQTGWLLGFGTPSQNLSMTAEKPLLELLWQVPTLGRADSQSEARALQTQVRRGKDVYLPAGQPLVIDNRLILRGMYETTAIDTRTGKRLWRSADADYRLPSGTDSVFRNFGVFYGGYAPSSRFSLRILFWHDRISHGMSSDGKRLFTVEGLELMPHGYNTGWGGGPRFPIGNRQVEDPRARHGNTIVARDARTGQVQWRAGKYPLVQKLLDELAQEINAKNKPQPKNDDETARDPVVESADEISEDERFLGETWFLGPPLPLFGRLNVIGENGGILRLFVLDARTGKLIRQQPLLLPPTPFEADYLRRYYGLTPSAANGILYCPTGLGMVAALDATTAAPLWCFSYLTPPKDEQNARNNFRNFRFPYNPAATNDDFQRLFAPTGWQFPCLMIEGNRLIVAPPDVPALYCLDAVTGELLWQKDTLKRPDTLYVACIRDGKVYIVTPVSMLALSLETGEAVWRYTLASVQQPTAGQSEVSSDLPPNLVFPPGVAPSGLGVLNDPQYFLPLSDGSVAVIDLDKGTFETVAPTPSRDDAPLGNLVGIHGRLFSQSPLHIDCFDQFEPLRRKTEAALADDPNDAIALMQLGRIRRAEGNIAEAIALFRRSLEQQQSDQTAILLRNTLLHAVRSDYAAWSSAAAELESLAEVPEELAETLLVLAEGAAKTGKDAEFVDALKKAFQLETVRTIRVPLGDGVETQLNRAFGTLVEQRLRNANQSPLSDSLEQVAEELFGRLASAEAAHTANRFQPPWWETDGTLSLAPELRGLQLFMEYFRTLPIAAKARDSLLNLYEKNERFAAVESMLNPPVRWFPLNISDASPASLSVTEIRRLAELSESQGNAASAFYYYRQLELFHADDRDGSLSGRELYEQALNRPLLKQYGDQEQAAKSWPSGAVEFPDNEPLATPEPGRINDRERLSRLLRIVQQRDHQTMAQTSVSLHGSFEPFHSPYTYSLEATINDSSLVCYDPQGNVRWRCDLSSVTPDIQENAIFPDHYSRGIGVQQMFLKGCNHYLLFARRNTLIALDTFRASETGSPTILWSKTLSAPLFAKQMFSAVRLYELNQQQIYTPWGIQQDGVSLGDSVHPLPNVVCYRDAETIYGVDPTTGETLWTRDVPSIRSTILSNREHLFLFSDELNQVLAIDPTSGQELARGIVPSGAFFTFETNLVFYQQSSGKFRLFVCDLRDVFKSHRERALLVSPNLSEGDALPTIATHTIRDNLVGDTVLRFANHQRFLATVTQQTAVLNIYDLQEKSDYFGERQGGAGARNGIKLPVRRQELRDAWDLDVELIDGNPLVLFIEKPNVDNNARDTEEYGERFQRSRQPLHGVQGRQVGLGAMMLYDRDGQKLWDEPAVIENWYRLTQTPGGLPVILFGVQLTDHFRRSGQTRYLIGLCGIDKKTGRARFSHRVPQPQNQQHSLLQGFRVTADLERYEMSFVAPLRTLTIQFTDKDPPPPSPPPPPKPTPKPFNILDFWPF